MPQMTSTWGAITHIPTMLHYFLINSLFSYLVVGERVVPILLSRVEFDFGRFMSNGNTAGMHSSL